MSDFLDEYRKLVHKRLRSYTGERLSPTLHESVLAEVVFFPSFHPEAILQATKSESTELRFTTFTSSLWYSSGVSGSGQLPKRVTEDSLLDRFQAEKMWSQLQQLGPQSIVDGNPIALDGMSIDAAYCTSESANFFSAWGPTVDSPQGQFVLSLYNLAWEVLTDEVSIERLEQLHGYLGLGLPCRVINESPRRLRVFGRLSSAHEIELRGFFKSFRSDEPLVIDMSNFDFMGTILYPLFVEFALVHQRLAWIGSPNAVRQLREIGVDESAICASISEARQKVREK